MVRSQYEQFPRCIKVGTDAAMTPWPGEARGLVLDGRRLGTAWVEQVNRGRKGLVGGRS